MKTSTILYLSFFFFVPNLKSFSQTISVKKCDSLKVTSLQYPVSNSEIDNFSGIGGKELIKINLDYHPLESTTNYISYPVWSILSESGDTLGQNYPYTYTFYFNTLFNNLIPRSKLVVDSQILALQARIYIHLHDNFENPNSSFACVIPFDQSPLGTKEKQTSDNNRSSFFPNPASSVLYLKDINERIDLVDQNGQTVFSEQNVTEINLTQIPRGMYTLRMRKTNGLNVIEKIVIE